MCYLRFWTVILYLLVFLAWVARGKSDTKKVECGYKQCPQTRDGALNVHLIPHSHMDAGWVKTFDEYYYGTKTQVSSANVQLIYHSVLSELLHDKKRKFTFSEVGFFWRWWKEQRPATRAIFRNLVQEGRVEFAGGGWVQNDEATIDYLAIIDLYTWGLRKLNDTLGPCGKPKAAWQIDTYGHTREQSSLLAQMGFDGLFISRVDHKEREAMIEDDRMEFMWRGSGALGKMSDIMTHTLFNLYNPPEGFCFDYLCNDEPINDDAESRVYNADKRVNDFIAHIERQAKYYDHDNIVVMMGGDFTYQSAATWFMNMDKLINHVTSHPANLSDINIFYSTPSCYLKAIYLYGRRDKVIHTETGDHIPYGTDAGTYWTGYYTSRPSLKYLIRKTHEFLQIFKQLTVVTRMPDSYELHLLRHSVALVQHHDAITGTTQQHVTDDFVRLLTEAISACSRRLSVLLSYLTPSWGGSRRPKTHQQFVMCQDLNISQCYFAESQEVFMILLYNPSSVKTYHYVRLPAAAMGFSIKDANDEEVEHQLVPLPSAVINLPGRKSAALQELFFEAENIPAMGYSAFYVTAIHDVLRENELAKKIAVDEEREKTSTISNEYIKVTVDKTTGLLESIQHNDGVKIDISQNFFYYKQVQANLNSGAYSFRPGQVVPVAQKVSYSTVKGTLIREIKQKFTDWITQVIRLYRGEEFVEFEWIVGPVPIGSDLGKEVVTRYSTNISNNMEFFTDSNARQMMKRSCDNDTYSPKLEKKSLPSCYYPITSRICIQSANSSVGMCVLTDRTQGGTSYERGQIELMLHRRLLTDDGFGLEETLNEEAYGVGLVVRGKHRVFFGSLNQNSADDQSFEERASALARRWRYEPMPFFSSGERINRRKWAQVRNKRFSALHSHTLPRHIHILTLEPWKAGSALLRLENTMENPTKDHHITLDLRKLFLQLRIVSFRETTLAANQWLDEARQMDWSTRYVYIGGTDGGMPEDEVDYRYEASPPERQDSEEDSHSHHRQKSNTKRKKQEYDNIEPRKRRSIDNATQITHKNTANKTNNHCGKIESNADQIHNTSALMMDIKKHANITSSRISIDQQGPIEHTDGERLTRKPGAKQRNNKIVNAPKRNLPRRSHGIITSIGRPTKMAPLGWDGSEEDIDFDEEMYESKGAPKRRRYYRKYKNTEKQGNLRDSINDEEITKSMYEMYYKNKSDRHNMAPKEISGSDEDEDTSRKRSKGQQKNEDHTDLDDNIEDKRPSEYSPRRSTYNRRRKGKMFLTRERNQRKNRIRPNVTEDDEWEDDTSIEDKKRRKEHFVDDFENEDDLLRVEPIRKYSLRNNKNFDNTERRGQISRHRSRIHKEYDDKEELNPLELEDDYSEQKSITRRPRTKTRSKRSSMPFNTYNNRQARPDSSSVLRTRLIKTKKSPNGAFVPFFITDDKMIRRIKDEEKFNFRESIRRAEEESDVLDVNDMYVKSLDTNAWRNEYQNEQEESIVKANGQIDVSAKIDDKDKYKNDKKIQELLDFYSKMMSTATPEKKKYNIFDDEEKFMKNGFDNNAETTTKNISNRFVEKSKNEPRVFRVTDDGSIEYNLNLKPEKGKLDAENVFKDKLVPNDQYKAKSEEINNEFNSEERAKGNGGDMIQDGYIDEEFSSKRRKRNKRTDFTSDFNESAVKLDTKDKLTTKSNLKVENVNKDPLDKTAIFNKHDKVNKMEMFEEFTEMRSSPREKGYIPRKILPHKIKTDYYETTTDQKTYILDTTKNRNAKNRFNKIKMAVDVNEAKNELKRADGLKHKEFDSRRKDIKDLITEVDGEEQMDESEQKDAEITERTWDVDDIGGEEELTRKRKKRNPRLGAYERPEGGGQEYIITLRPTQIRTFVVWFGDIRKHAV